MPFGAAVSKIKPLPLLELAEGLTPEVLLVSDRACRILMDGACCVNTKKPNPASSTAHIVPKMHFFVFLPLPASSLSP